MFRKNYYLFIVVFALFAAGSITTFAQTTAEITGRVELKKADGTTEPFEGALVEVFRVDQKGGGLSDKTDKNGNFAFAGVALGGTYVLSVSGTGIGPALSQNLKPGSKGVLVEVSAGDGKQLTEDEVRQVLTAAATQSGQMTAEEKKAEEERLKKVAEIESKNKKIEASNDVISRSLEEGVKAFDAKNYDLAIVKFEEGYNASPDYIGSAPGMLNNKAASLVRRAVANYNKMVQSKDATEKTELKPKVKQDFENAIEAYNMAWDLSKNAKPDEIAKIQKNFEASRNQTLVGSQDAVNLMIRTESTSEAKKDAVLTLMREYIAFEKDQKKKEAAQTDLASYMLTANDYDNAIVEYRKAVEMSPNNADAVGGLGLSLWTMSYGSEETAKKQEALNYMQHFLDIAPKDHKLRDGIEGGVADLKAQKLKPQKITAKN